ncbi:MAG: hypothetical protein IJI24_00420 [Lachnospiraceae bacterium]|nr:hypothetical protein [Oscillospiraceae bacterium]MBQ6321310.1 hypothetical protein [Lachnospiraceae bacterium]
MEQTLKDYSWDLEGYMPRASQAERGKLTMQDAFRAYQLIPAPPGLPSGDTNEYIRLAQETHELKYIFFYLHENEQYFNDRINTFLTGEGERVHPERLMDLKLECRMEVLKRFPSYDPGRGTAFITYIHRYITDALLRFRMGEEYHSFDSLQEYKDARHIMQIFAECNGNTKETIRLFAEQDGCSEKTAAEKLAAAWRQRNRRVPVQINEEGECQEQQDELIPDHWDYAGILWAGMEAEAVDKAFDKLSYRDQTLLEQRNAICMRCGRVSDMKTQMPFEKLAELFEGSGASGAERAYKRAIEYLMLELVRLGQLHCVRIKQISVRRADKKITAAVYAYQVDNGGDWGEIQFDLNEKTAWVETFAENDPCDTWEVTDAAIRVILANNIEKLPKSMLFSHAGEELIRTKHMK